MAVVFNSFINPIIYCVRMRQFRVAFIELLLRKSSAQAEDMELRVCGKLKSVSPLEEAQNNNKNDNRNNEKNN